MRRFPTTVLLFASCLACSAADHEQFMALVKLGLQGTQLILVDSLPFKTSKGIGDQLALFDAYGTRFNATASLRPDDSISLIRIERLNPGSTLPEPVITVPCVITPDFDPLQVHGLVVPTVVEADKADAVQASLGRGPQQGTVASIPRGVGPGFGGGGGGGGGRTTIVPPTRNVSPH